MPTINRVIRNMFADDAGTVEVSQGEYDALLRERAAQLAMDPDARMADMERRIMELEKR